MITRFFGYRIYNQRGKEIPNCNTHKFPFLDIFIVEEKNGKIYYNSSNIQSWGKRDGEEIFIKKEELYPLKLYNFGEIKIWGPNNPIPFLNAIYPNWQNIAQSWYDHSQEKPIVLQTFEIKEKHKKPAQPTGPLQNRVN